MDMGQMMTVVQQMPASQNVVAGGEVHGQMEQNSPFAGVLQGLSVQDAAQEVTDLERISQMPLDVVAALLAGSSSGVSVMTPEATDLPSQKITTDDKPDGEDSESQNVIANLGEAQIAQMFTQQHGRMPDVDENPATQVSQLTDVLETTAPVNTVISCAGGDTTVHVTPETITSRHDSAQAAVKVAEAKVASKSAETVRPVFSANDSTGVNASAAQKESAEKMSGEVLSTHHQMEAAVTLSDKPVLSVENNRSRQDTVQSAALLEKQTDSRIETSQRQGMEISRPQALAVTSVNQTVLADVAVKAPAPSAPALKSTALVVGTENRVLQLETPEQNSVTAQRSMSLPEAQSTQMPRSDETRLAAQPVTPVELSRNVKLAQVDGVAVKQVVEQSVSTVAELSEASMSQPETVTPHAIQHKVHASAPVVSLAAAYATEALPENNPVRINPRDAGRIQNMEKVDPVTTIVAVDVEEKNVGSDGESLGQSTNGNVLPNAMHQQVKTEGLATVGTVAGTDASNSSRTSQPAEQVVQQVRERLVNHVAKPGSEQIVLRLSPEHLGDLRVNLNLEGQRLKVEIVAENSMVRDSLLQNTDLLKESLSRQNIKMESFDVTTGGNSTADNSRGQGEWRELAQRRQQNLWMPEGGYRMAKQAAPAVAAYQPKSQHTMVDVHF